MNASNPNAPDTTIQNLALVSWVWVDSSNFSASAASESQIGPTPSINHASFDLLRPIRQWLNQIEVRHPNVAHQICKLIPAQCPFERDITLFNYTLFHIPPLCKLNPLYEEVVGLRFRALCYLADECGEDVSPYC
jgi:hypothetical protein